MKILLLLLLLILLISCGQGDKKSKDCSTGLNIQKVWTLQGTNINFDMSSCAPYQVCTMCVSNTCNGQLDFTIQYTPEGGATIDYTYYNNVKTANWKVCGTSLELYNFSDGSSSETYINNL